MPTNPLCRLMLAALLVALPGAAHCDAAGGAAPSGAAPRTPLPGLDAALLQRFRAGEAEFAARWVVFPSGGGHWGLGPQSSAQSCAQCHAGGGRGSVPDGEPPPASLVLRLSVPGSDTVGGPRPHPAYGEQLNSQGVLGRLLEEGRFRIG
jgi:CxxC motif-containing protein (DUF1111 family)